MCLHYGCRLITTLPVDDRFLQQFSDSVSVVMMWLFLTESVFLKVYITRFISSWVCRRALILFFFQMWQRLRLHNWQYSALFTQWRRNIIRPITKDTLRGVSARPSQLHFEQFYRRGIFVSYKVVKALVMEKRYSSIEQCYKLIHVNVC